MANSARAPGRPPESRGTLARVVEEIGLRIMRQVYPPGDPMPTEAELGSELRVSRTVIREVIKTLTAKGLVESRPKVGTRVRPRSAWNLLDPVILNLYCQVADFDTFARQFQQLRFIVEPEASALAAVNRTPEGLEAIEGAFEQMRDARDLAAWTAADLKFHQAILEASGNEFLRPLGALIEAALESLLFRSAQNSPNPFDSLTEHERVLQGVRDQDPEHARQMMRALLSNTALSIDASRGRKPGPKVSRTKS